MNCSKRTFLQAAKATALFLAVAAPAAEPLVSPSRTQSAPRTNWAEMPPRRTYELAEKGDLHAQFWFATWEWNTAFEESYSQARRQAAAEAEALKLTDAEKEAARQKWRNASELDLHEAVSAGDRQARWYLGVWEVDHGLVLAQDACERFKRTANAGVPAAEYQLARIYLNGSRWNLLPRDRDEAFKWLRRSVDHGYEGAQHMLADFLLLGTAVPPDFGLGITLLQKAADQECARAQYELACHYIVCEGDPRNKDDTPLALLQKSARAGYRDAQTALGNRYRMGFTVDKDLVVACRLYRAGAALDENGNYRLSRVDITRLLDQKLEPLLNPPGVMTEFAELSPVASLYLKATERADAEAMCRIGALYIEGKVVPRNPVEAYRWYEAAAKAGSPGAAKARDQLKNQLTPEQTSDAAREPNDLRPVNRKRSDL